jgi:hypothetical protein
MEEEKVGIKRSMGKRKKGRNIDNGEEGRMGRNWEMEREQNGLRRERSPIEGCGWWGGLRRKTLNGWNRKNNKQGENYKKNNVKK